MKITQDRFLDKRPSLMFWMILLFVVVCILSVIGIYRNEKAWERYSVNNHCRITSIVAGRYDYIPDYKGSVRAVWVSGQKTYACDNGVTVTR